MIRRLGDRVSSTASNEVGSDNVLLARGESGCGIAPIAVAELVEDEFVSAHIHSGMQDGFCDCDIPTCETMDGENPVCPKGDCVIDEDSSKFYPMLFKKNRKVLVWGTEDWTVSAVAGAESEIENGTWARCLLSDVIAKYPEDVLGKHVAEQYNNKLPLLSKIIRTHADLSIQVHPNDEMAQREHGKLGKSEMWYIIDAAPDACLYAGFKDQITPEEYERHVANGTIAEVLAKHEVHAGDVFYLPAGRVHALCSGITLAEIQQSSDVTYRIYDYNRLGLDGNPRELHTELAAKAIDYTVYSNYKTDKIRKEDAVSELLNTPHFSVNLLESNRDLHRNMIKYDSFVILMNLGGSCQISVNSTKDKVILNEGESCLIPATIADYHLESDGDFKVLEAFIDNEK